MQILGPDRYNPEKLKELEADVVAQADGRAPYNPDVNFTVLRIYQFYPTYANAGVVQKALLMVRVRERRGSVCCSLVGSNFIRSPLSLFSLSSTLFTLHFSCQISFAMMNKHQLPSTRCHCLTAVSISLLTPPHHLANARAGSDARPQHGLQRLLAHVVRERAEG